MSRARAFVEASMPWAGLAVGLVAASFVHQFGSEGTFDHCETLAPGPAIVVAVIGLVVTLAAGLMSWRSRQSSEGSRRLISTVSAGMALLFAFAIILPVIAASLIPSCFQ
jgi:flagellar biosynthesis component FlhA